MKTSRIFTHVIFFLLLLCSRSYAVDAIVAPDPQLYYGTGMAGGKLYTYVTGTTTPKTTWSDSAKSATNTNPITLDSQGRANVFIDPTDSAYRFKLTTSGGTVVYTKDGIGGTIDTGIQSLQTVDTVTDLRGMTGANGLSFWVSGYYTAFDGGGVERHWVTGAPGTYTDGCQYIVPTGGDGSGAWALPDGNRVINVRWCGGRETEDIAPVINNIWDELGSRTTVYVPGSLTSWKLTTSITPLNTYGNELRLVGDGYLSTRFTIDEAVEIVGLNGYGSDEFEVKDLSISDAAAGVRGSVAIAIGGTSMKVADVWLSSTKYGILGTSVSGALVTNTYIENCTHNLYLSANAADGTITGFPTGGTVTNVTFVGGMSNNSISYDVIGRKGSNIVAGLNFNGFKFQQGNGIGLVVSDSVGGDVGIDATFNGCTFSDNAGGGISVTKAHVSMSGCVFDGNTSSGIIGNTDARIVHTGSIFRKSTVQTVPILDNGGSVIETINPVNGINTTLTFSNSITVDAATPTNLIFSGGTAGRTATFPAATLLGNKVYNIKNADADNALTLATITSLYPGESAKLWSDGTNYQYSVVKNGWYKLTYDFATQGGTIGDIALGPLFSGTTITQAYYEVTTPFTSGGAATVAFGVSTNDPTGLKGATAYNHADYGAGYHAFIPDGTVANFTTKTTSTRNVIMTIAGANLTAGGMTIWLKLID